MLSKSGEQALASWHVIPRALGRTDIRDRSGILEMIVHEIYPSARVVLPVSQINEYESEGVESSRLEPSGARSISSEDEHRQSCRVILGYCGAMRWPWGRNKFGGPRFCQAVNLGCWGVGRLLVGRQNERCGL